jgi:crossover junction endodeoxyribonuclease RuvC
VILGIDPGSNIMGYAVLATVGKHITLKTYGVERFTHHEDHLLKIQGVFERTIAIIEEYLPDELAIEAPFFGKNVQSMLKLGRAQGACIAAALSRQIPVVEYAPKKVKQAVTGKGTATKEQVAYMMKALLGISDDTLPLDATDACAIALCHYYSQTTMANKASKSWTAFLKENPDRLK